MPFQSRSSALPTARRRIDALKGLYKLWQQFGSERMNSDLPHIRDRMQRYDLLIPPQESGPRRFELINSAITKRGYQTYLEIGVRDPADCFNRVVAPRRWSVDPGLEFRSNPVDFPVTSDEFFSRCDQCPPPGCPPKWDVIFIDGLHRAEQVWRDIQNASRYLSSGGMIFLHDCLPPSEVFARERFEWALESRVCWNGTCWKALARYLEQGPFHAMVVETDWGVGVIDGSRVAVRDSWRCRNDFFEYDQFVQALRESDRAVSPSAFIAAL